ncbi:MAG: hypothetical protein F6J95_000960 [Leptolyngbya sp. SIO1E4]|nr:hypothetical protein [Leptolyngbya sp. SIO1E4]
MPAWMFYLAYGEGQFGSTATGIALGLIALVVGCIIFGVYSYRTYPMDRD